LVIRIVRSLVALLYSEMRALRALLALAMPMLFGVALSSCREGPHSPAGVAASKPAVISKPETAVAQQAMARAEQVCRLLQGGPAERRAACCGSSGGGHVESECVRVLGAALAAGRVAIDDSALSRCSEVLPAAFEGCDWVTPGQPMPPPECRGFTRGLTNAGGACRSSLECAAPLHCEGGTPTQAGRCSPPLADGAACRAPSDNLAALLFASELERQHPSCAGVCSLASHRCEQRAPEPHGERALGARGGAAPAGGACRTDFDCQRGGCAAGVCGAKCAVSMADAARLSSLPPLALPRRSPSR
jgi:hypothetical protein